VLDDFYFVPSKGGGKASIAVAPAPSLPEPGEERFDLGDLEGRAQRGASVTTARIDRATGPFQVNVMVCSIRCGNLAQQEGTAIPQLWNEMSELMAGVGHGQGGCALGDAVTGEDGRALR